jgi:hypothetical protein
MVLGFGFNHCLGAHLSMTMHSFMELPREYWCHKMLFEISSTVGTPLSLDDYIKNRVFGHYLRILVDMDLFGCFFEAVMVEHEGFSFNVDVPLHRFWSL